MDLEALATQARQFAEAREWQQFHTPKNLAMALAAEAGEVLEIFRWLTEAESTSLATSKEDLELVTEELADVLICLMRLADVLGINLENAVTTKLRLNAQRYPVAVARGNAIKYNRRGC